MKHEDLPERWLLKLRAHLEEIGEGGDRLSAYEFHHHLKLTFEDGSSAFFYYAFYILDETLNEVAVFTEHCGYHVFPAVGTKLEILESRWVDVNPE
jgi:hypothetical protein